MPEQEITNIGEQETDDFIKDPPSWLIRNGMILMIAIFVVLIAGAYYIEYPDTIEGKGIIRALPSPVKIYSPMRGKLSLINVKDSTKVKQNDIIATYNDDPSNQIMLNTSKLINLMDTSKNIKQLLFENEFCSVLKIVETEKKDLEFVDKVNKIKLQPKKYFAKQSENFVRKSLFPSIEKLKRDINHWKNKNTLTSPIDGFIYYLKDSYKDNNVEKGEALFAVVPSNYSYFIQVEISPSSISYIKKGQKCFIKIEEYPYQRFGLLTGTVSKVNNLFNDSTYTVTVLANKGLFTTKMVQIPDKNKYFINVSIIVRNRSLLDRLISLQGN